MNIDKLNGLVGSQLTNNARSIQNGVTDWVNITKKANGIIGDIAAGVGVVIGYVPDVNATTGSEAGYLYDVDISGEYSVLDGLRVVYTFKRNGSPINLYPSQDLQRYQNIALWANLKVLSYPQGDVGVPVGPTTVHAVSNNNVVLVYQGVQRELVLDVPWQVDTLPDILFGDGSHKIALNQSGTAVLGLEYYNPGGSDVQQQ